MTTVALLTFAILVTKLSQENGLPAEHETHIVQTDLFPQFVVLRQPCSVELIEIVTTYLVHLVTRIVQFMNRWFEVLISTGVKQLLWPVYSMKTNTKK